MKVGLTDVTEEPKRAVGEPSLTYVNSPKIATLSALKEKRS